MVLSTWFEVHIALDAEFLTWLQVDIVLEVDDVFYVLAGS